MTSSFQRLVLRRGLLVIAACFYSGCSPEPAGLPEQRKESPVLPQAGSEAATGMIWEVRKDNVRAYLVGSFHLLRPTDYPLPAAYESAWKASSHAVFEIHPSESGDPETARAVEQLAAGGSGSELSEQSPELWQELTRWGEKTGYPAKSLAKLPLWMAALRVTVETTGRLGFSSTFGLEKHYAGRLPGSGKTSEALETTIGQLSLLNALPAATQEAMLRQSLADAPVLAEKASALAGAWRQGDADELYSIMLNSFRGFPEVRDLLLTQRNAAWIPRIEGLLEGNKITFILVGAGHLCGPGSLVERLEEKGYQCFQLKNDVLPSSGPGPAQQAGDAGR